MFVYNYLPYEGDIYMIYFYYMGVRRRVYYKLQSRNIDY
jgi:hypothetical protein